MTAAINCLRVNQDAAFTRKPMPDLADAETRRETALKRMCERFLSTGVSGPSIC